MLKMVPPTIALLLLAGIGIDRAYRYDVPAEADAYHERVQNATDRIPYQFGDWVGVDTEIRQDALRILNPNVAFSRRYDNVKTGRSATLVVVHCADTRNLLGHYPPACYPSQGWSPLASTPKTITTEGGAIEAREYTFAYDTLSESARLGVLHFTALPDGRIAPDMADLEQTSRSRTTRTYGGASVQFIVDADLPESERDAIYETLVDVVGGWLKSVDIGDAV